MVQGQQHPLKGYRPAYYYDGLTRRSRMGIRDGEQYSHRSIRHDSRAGTRYNQISTGGGYQYR